MSDAAAALLTASDRNPDGDGVVLADRSAHRQWLCGIYRVEALRASADRLRTAGALASAPARSLFDGMRLHEVCDPGGLSDDIDTPAAGQIEHANTAEWARHDILPLLPYAAERPSSIVAL